MKQLIALTALTLALSTLAGTRAQAQVMKSDEFRASCREQQSPDILFDAAEIAEPTKLTEGSAIYSKELSRETSRKLLSLVYSHIAKSKDIGTSDLCLPFDRKTLVSIEKLKDLSGWPKDQAKQARRVTTLIAGRQNLKMRFAHVGDSKALFAKAYAGAAESRVHCFRYSSDPITDLAFVKQSGTNIKYSDVVCLAERGESSDDWEISTVSFKIENTFKYKNEPTMKVSDVDMNYERMRDSMILDEN